MAGRVRPESGHRSPDRERPRWTDVVVARSSESRCRGRAAGSVTLRHLQLRPAFGYLLADVPAAFQEPAIRDVDERHTPLGQERDVTHAVLHQHQPKEWVLR